MQLEGESEGEAPMGVGASAGILALMGESFWARKDIGDLDLILCLLEVSLLDLAGGG